MQPKNHSSKVPLLSLMLAFLAAGRLSAADDLTVSHWKEHDAVAKKAMAAADWRTAESALSSAVEEAESFGDKDSRLYDGLRNLAFARTQLRMYDEAENSLRRLTAVAQTQFGAGSDQSAEVLNALAGVEGYRNSFQTAEELSLAAQNHFEKKYGPYDPFVGLCLQGRGERLLMQGKYAAAEQLLTKAVDYMGNTRIVFSGLRRMQM